MAPRLGSSRVNELLVLRGKSQANLADHLGVTEGYISQVCNNLANLSVINWKRTARFLNVQMDDLIIWDESLFKPLDK